MLPFILMLRSYNLVVKLSHGVFHSQLKLTFSPSIFSGGGSCLKVGGMQIEAEGQEREGVLGEGPQPPSHHAATPHQLGGLGSAVC